MPDREAKSVSHETTFATDIADGEILQAWLVELVEQVARRLRRHGIQGRSVERAESAARRLHDALTLPRPTHVTQELLDAGLELLTTRLPGRRLPGRRLPGRRLPGRRLPGRRLPSRRLLGRRLPGRRLPGRRLRGRRLRGRRQPLRPLGFGVHRFGEVGQLQQPLFDQPARERQRELDRVADQIAAKFGKTGGRRATSMDKGH